MPRYSPQPESPLGVDALGGAIASEAAAGAEEVEGAYSAYKYAMCKHACPTSWRLPI